MSTPSPVDAALARAEAALARGPRAALSQSAAGTAPARTHRLVIGDPQADVRRFLALLERHGVLAPDGALRPEVQLLSVGDHFDWGGRAERAQVAQSSLLLVAWLASHPADQAVMLLGNHDLGRVGELAHFTDATFAAAQVEADRAYAGGEPDAALEEAFLARHPEVPNAELVARDFSTFREAQRQWVEALLCARRFRVAHAAAGDLLVLHAGVTDTDLQALGLAREAWASAPRVAAALNAALDAAVDAWRSGPLVIPVLHQPGSVAVGEGRGIFYHRPTLQPEDAQEVQRTPRRRFDPRRLPLGLTQVVGHTRDKKSRELLQLSGTAAVDGVLRHLVTDGAQVRYRLGTPVGAPRPDEAVLVFTDGGMRETPVEAFELLDVERRAAAQVP
ncbi:transcriptional regulator [Aggregicoccus sp. 17bor-14]|uniref:metallophosphoesterase n=1 Tax=Myxococcaceae TaxID=31 RepID=UPI00129C9420|nr:MULTISPECIES: metallophosphoesterase [Myxococcaceae]MBF5046087.1 metallophosphoesterase [Simulacricoccus sp. 17bor-14]MRI91816.1 transcriptional regulator [Aggregicoccus sp. 17bor-14]